MCLIKMQLFESGYSDQNKDILGCFVPVEQMTESGLTKPFMDIS